MLFFIPVSSRLPASNHQASSIIAMDNGRRSANRANHIVIDAVLTGDTMSGVNNRRTKP
jgi:hypothetical protein